MLRRLGLPALHRLLLSALAAVCVIVAACASTSDSNLHATARDEAAPGATGPAATAPRATAPAASRARASAVQDSAIATPFAFRFQFENLEGALLLEATLRSASGRDTTGLLILDTGAGYLGLDAELLRRLGLAEETGEPMTFAPKPLPRLAMGELQQDVVGPLLTIDSRVIRQAIDRDVFGLLGQQPLNSFAVRIDYLRDSLALIPVRRDGLMATPSRRTVAIEMGAAQAARIMALRASREALGGWLPRSAIGCPFELEGDGKILVRASFGSRSAGAAAAPALTLVLDTGATKTVLFESAVRNTAGREGWPELRGLSAPTLYGSEEAHLVRVPEISIGSGEDRASVRDVDAVVMEGPLQSALRQAVGRDVDGLIGASILRRFRVTIDYPHRIVWFEPIAVPKDQREYEYSHIGVQIERHEGRLRVVSVAEGSPAEKVGLREGDEVAALDGTSADSLDVVTLSRRLEGPPNSVVQLEVRRGGEALRFRVTRKRLL